MTEREALKLALEALEEAWYHVGTFQPTEKAIDLYDEARTAIKEALAQPEQDWWHHEEALKMDKGKLCYRHIEENQSLGGWRSVITDCFIPYRDGTKFYTTPPQRKPLTDEEIINEADRFDWGKDCAVRFARAIEAAHGIKGEA